MHFYFSFPSNLSCLSLSSYRHYGCYFFKTGLYSIVITPVARLKSCLLFCYCWRLSAGAPLSICCLCELLLWPNSSLFLPVWRQVAYCLAHVNFQPWSWSSPLSFERLQGQSCFLSGWETSSLWVQFKLSWTLVSAISNYYCYCFHPFSIYIIIYNLFSGSDFIDALNLIFI